jgi:hypothetical protein
MTTIDWWAIAQVILWTMVPFFVGLFIGLLSSNRMDEWDDDGEADGLNSLREPPDFKLTASERHTFNGDKYGC